MLEAKGANLAEIFNLKNSGSPGFVVTAQAYDYFIKKARLDEKIKNILSKIDYENTKQLDESTKQIRDLIINSEFPAEMREEILETYETLSFTDYDIKESEALEILEANSEPVFCGCPLKRNNRRFSRGEFCRTARYLFECKRK